MDEDTIPDVFRTVHTADSHILVSVAIKGTIEQFWTLNLDGKKKSRYRLEKLLIISVTKGIRNWMVELNMGKEKYEVSSRYGPVDWWKGRQICIALR